MFEASPFDRLQLVTLTGGRATFALGKSKQEPEAAGNPKLMADFGLAEEAAEALITVESRWQVVQVMSHSRGDAGPINDALDLTAGSIFTQGVDRAKHIDPKSDDGKALARFMLHWFPNGATSITLLPYEDELAVLKRLLAALQGPDAGIVRLLEISFYVRRLAELLPQFEAALGVAKPEDLAFGKVRAARAKLQLRMKQVVVRILADYGADDQTEVLERLLAPILFQEEQVKRLRRANRPVVDVNPSTGVELTEQPVAEGVAAPG